MNIQNQTRVKYLTGFGLESGADMYSVITGELEEALSLIKHAGENNLKVVQRGAGRSYGDSAWQAEQVSLSTGSTEIKWTSESTAWVGGQCTLRMLCEECLLKGLWPKVVTGTALPTIAGLVASNAHGKNAYKVGTFGDSVLAIKLLLASGELIEVFPEDELFWSICGSMGLLGVIWEVHLELEKAATGFVLVKPTIINSLRESFSFFEESSNSDYAVCWLDFTRSTGVRGIGHSAIYSDLNQKSVAKFSPPNVKLSSLAKFMKPLVSRQGIMLANQIKFMNDKRHSGKKFTQSLPDFNFLLDKIPNWQTAYLPNGLVQVQIFIPKDQAEQCFDEVFEIMQKSQIFTSLAVMKRHNLSECLLNPGVDGYSLALDFVARRENELWQEFMDELHQIATIRGGRFYLAKDSLLKPEDWKTSLPEGNLQRFLVHKALLDPKGLFSSNQARRLGIIE